MKPDKSDFDRACQTLGLNQKQIRHLSRWLQTTEDTRKEKPSYEDLLRFWGNIKSLLKA